MVVINNLYPQVIKTCRPLIVEDEVLKLLTKKFYESVSRSLTAESSGSSTVKCKLTHVTDFPDGTEKGSFIGLDFSGKIFRLVHVILRGDRTYMTNSRLYEFPELKPTGGHIKVFDYVAKCVNNFVDVYGICQEKLILGVSSIFPMEQDSLQEGTVLDWSREFRANDQNQDFFTQLKISLKKYKNTKGMYLISLISNSTACLLSGLYRDPWIRIGLFLGDHTNITYIEKYKNMTAYTGDGLRARTAIEVGMSGFGDDGILDFIKTDFDLEIDASSKNPGIFTLEKLISASYLGEIARLCLLKLASSGVILNGYVSPGLIAKDSLKTADLAVMEMDDEKKFTRCRAVMFSLGYKKVSDADCVQIRFVSRCVARRSSNLVAACLSAMIHRMESKDVRIIGGGSLLKEFPNYEYYLVKKINQLKKPEVKYHIIKDEKEDIGVGAGLVAHIYKESLIKLEDKYRSLPPFDLNKYSLKNLPASLIDCDCESVPFVHTKYSDDRDKNETDEGSIEPISAPSSANGDELLLRSFNYV